MNNTVKNFLIHNFEWMKTELFIHLILTILVTLVCYFAPNLSVLMKLATVSTLFAINYRFFLVRTSQISKTNPNNFTWKFLQSLPMSRPDMVKSIILSHLMAAIPLLFGFLCLGKLINGLVFYNELSVPKIFINLTLLIIIMSMLSIFSLIHLQRNAHQKKEKANFFLAVFALGCGFIAFVLYASSERLGVLIVETFPLLGHSFFSFSTFFSWWSVPALVLIGIFFHYRLLRFWTNEKFSYREKTLANNLNFQYSVMATGSMLLIYAFTALYLDIPLIYKGRVTEAVFRGQLEEVKAALSFAPDINAKNQYGLTPMMAAVRAGDLKLVKFLHEKGANFEGTVVNAPGEFNGIDVPGLAIKSKNKSLVDFLLSKNVNFNLVNAVTGNAPIHMAAFICDSQMVDSLIKHGSDVNIINVKGQTPLILAAQKGCLSASIVLKEAGARFDIVDKEGKMALDRAGESKINESELKYFLEKNTRTPASH